MVFPPHSLGPEQLGKLLDAEREGLPFVAYRDDSGELRLETLAAAERLRIGRGEHNAIALDWDPEVSRTHAQLELVGDEWTGGRRRPVAERLVRERRARGRPPTAGGRRRRARRADVVALPRARAGDGDHRLPRPCGRRPTDRCAAPRPGRALPSSAHPDGGNAPAGNREIAAELHLSVDGVKTHLRALFDRARDRGAAAVPQARRAARRAIDLGLVRSATWSERSSAKKRERAFVHRVLVGHGRVRILPAHAHDRPAETDPHVLDRLERALDARACTGMRTRRRRPTTRSAATSRRRAYDQYGWARAAAEDVASCDPPRRGCGCGSTVECSQVLATRTPGMYSTRSSSSWSKPVPGPFSGPRTV